MEAEFKQYFNGTTLVPIPALYEDGGRQTVPVCGAGTAVGSSSTRLIAPPRDTPVPIVMSNKD
jgi:hypothetical protein